MTKNVTIHALARTFATNQNSADNSAVRLSAHPDFHVYVAQASAPKVGKASPIVAAAKAILGVTDARGTKTGPAGAQKWTKYGEGVTGQGVENVAALLKRAMVNDAPKPVTLAVTLSGDGVDGGRFVVPADHPLRDALLALLVPAAV